MKLHKIPKIFSPLLFQPTRHPSGQELVSPMKKKRRRSLTQAEALAIIRDHNRNLTAAATTIAQDYFMKVPVDLEDFEEIDPEELEATIEAMRAKLGEFMWCRRCFMKFELALIMIVISVISIIQGVS